MDIGTKKDPGRELNVEEIRDTAGGHMEPGIDDLPSPPQDVVGGGAPAPVDYSQP